jgi:hypothetical protein
MNPMMSTLTSDSSLWLQYHLLYDLYLFETIDLTDPGYKQIHLSEKILKDCLMLK